MKRFKLLKKINILLIMCILSLFVTPTKNSYAWGEIGHTGTVYTGYLTDDERAIIIAASQMADAGSYGPTGVSNMSLHGGTTNITYLSGGNNYVSDIRYLYQAALNTRNGLAIPASSIYNNVSSNMYNIATYAKNLILD